MGFGVKGGYSSKKEKSKTSSRTTRKVDEVQTESGARQSQQQANQMTSSLSKDVQDLVTNLIEEYGAQMQGGGTAQSQSALALANLMNERAQAGGVDMSNLINPIMDAARRSGERELKSLETRFAREAGGSIGNTFVTAATAEGRAGLESQLAAQEAELGLQTRQIQTQELISALGALSEDPQGSSISNFTQLLNVLKGSSVEQKSARETAEQTESELTRKLDELIIGSGKSSGRTSGWFVQGEAKWDMSPGGGTNAGGGGTVY